MLGAGDFFRRGECSRTSRSPLKTRLIGTYKTCLTRGKGEPCLPKKRIRFPAGEIRTFSEQCKKNGKNVFFSKPSIFFKKNICILFFGRYINGWNTINGIMMTNRKHSFCSTSARNQACCSAPFFSLFNSPRSEANAPVMHASLSFVLIKARFNPADRFRSPCFLPFRIPCASASAPMRRLSCVFSCSTQS